MCELLGLSFNKPVDIQISFTGFRERGRIYREGWGIRMEKARFGVLKPNKVLF